MAIISIRNFVIYKSNYEIFSSANMDVHGIFRFIYTWYNVRHFQDVKSFSLLEVVIFSLISLKPAMYLQWDGSTNVEMFSLTLPNFCWLHQQLQKKAKIGHFWCWQPLRSNKNFLGTNQNPTNVTWLEGQYNLLSIPFR